MDNPEKLATRRGDQEWTIQRNWQHWVHNTQDKDKQKKQHRKLKDEQHGLHQKLGMNPCACEGLSVPASYKTIAT